jgi:Fatty acid cis/trans isomerase (CTI)
MSRDQLLRKSKVRSKVAVTLALIFFIAGCSALAIRNFDKEYGRSQVRNRIASGVIPGPNYYRNVKPILDKRCAVCHSCYDAPCQINLTSVPGIDRGANSSPVYDSKRLFASDPTRLYVDAATTSEWRTKGFYPILNERDQSALANTQGSTLYLSLLQKKKHPLPAGEVLPDSLTFSDNHNEQCPTVEEYSEFAQENPLWGMPYGLPGISDAEFVTLSNWLTHGALAPPRERLPHKYLERIKRWERFLNGASLQEQLMSRYIYEHIFLGHLYFDDLPQGEYFTLVRSKTAPGTPIDIISTRRVYDDPEVPHFYYRLMREESTVMAKTHMPFALGAERMKFWTKLFLNPKIAVTELPSYRPEVAANPFLSFKSIPLSSRYEFMLDEAEFFVSGFIKGPVCHGNTAVNAIQDRFWIFFASPEISNSLREDQFLQDHSEYMRLPSEGGSNSLVLSKWLQYSKLQKTYFNAKKAWLVESFEKPESLTAKFIWDGEQKNTSAALTVFRHYDSATAVGGLLGDTPKTIWIIGYTLFERLHYLLVAGFDVFGNIGHQANSRLYMDFLRIEAEHNFLSLLPEAARKKERDHWYRGASKEVIDLLWSTGESLSVKRGLSFASDNPKEELLQIAKKQLADVVNQRFSLPSAEGGDSQILARLSGLPGKNVRFMPQLSFLRVRGDKSSTVFTLLHDSAYSNVATPLHEEDRRLPHEDSLLAVPGILGAYPNAFFDLEQGQLADFVAGVAGIESEDDYRRLVTKYGVRRSSETFWAFSDWLHEAYRIQSPIEAGLFDYSHFENR